MENSSKLVGREPLVLLLSKNDFTAIERKIYWAILSQMNQGFNVSSDLFQNKEFIISLDSLQETNRSRVKSAIEKITYRRLYYENPKGDEFEIITPFPHAKYEGSKGIIRITMFANVVPYFMELKNGYSEFELFAALSLSSEYSQKLYPLLSRWKDTGIWNNIEIEQLKDTLKATHYKRLVHFKQRVLDQAVKEINEKTDLEISIDYKKTGRIVTHITFNILSKSKKEQRTATLAVKEEMDSVANLNIGQIMAQASQILSTYNFSATQYMAIMTKPELLQVFIEEDSKITHGVRKDVKNKTAYMATILGFSKKKK